MVKQCINLATSSPQRDQNILRTFRVMIFKINVRLRLPDKSSYYSLSIFRHTFSHNIEIQTVLRVGRKTVLTSFSFLQYTFNSIKHGCLGPRAKLHRTVLWRYPASHVRWSCGHQIGQMGFLRVTLFSSHTCQRA